VFLVEGGVEAREGWRDISAVEEEQGWWECKEQEGFLKGWIGSRFK
jgi:hypothetical protein